MRSERTPTRTLRELGLALTLVAVACQTSVATSPSPPHTAAAPAGIKAFQDELVTDVDGLGVWSAPLNGQGGKEKFDAFAERSLKDGQVCCYVIQHLARSSEPGDVNAIKAAFYVLDRFRPACAQNALSTVATDRIAATRSREQAFKTLMGLDGGLGAAGSVLIAETSPVWRSDFAQALLAHADGAAIPYLEQARDAEPDPRKKDDLALIAKTLQHPDKCTLYHSERDVGTGMVCYYECPGSVPAKRVSADACEDLVALPPARAPEEWIRPLE